MMVNKNNFDCVNIKHDSDHNPMVNCNSIIAIWNFHSWKIFHRWRLNFNSFKNIMKFLTYKNANDCLVCAIKPLLKTGITITFIAKSKCQHTDNVSKPVLQEKTSYTVFAILWISVVIFNIFIMMYKLIQCNVLSKEMKYRYISLLPNFIDATLYTLSCILYKKSYFIYTNALVELIHGRTVFGIEAILDRTHTRFLQKVSLSVVIVHGVILLATVILILCQREEFGFEYFSLSISLIIINVNITNFALYLVVILIIYKASLKEALASMRRELQLPSESFLQKIQGYQRFYLACVFNYKKHVFASINVMVLIVQFVFMVFLVVKNYLQYFGIVDTQEKWVWLSIFKWAFTIFAVASLLTFSSLSSDILLVVCKFCWSHSLTWLLLYIDSKNWKTRFKIYQKTPNTTPHPHSLRVGLGATLKS